MPCSKKGRTSRVWVYVGYSLGLRSNFVSSRDTTADLSEIFEVDMGGLGLPSERSHRAYVRKFSQPIRD